MFNGKVFIEAIEELSKTKGIDKDSILKAIKEAMEKGYSKQLGGNGSGVLCDALVNVNIDPEKNLITMCQQKKVVATEDDITDDFIEISLDEAKEKYPDIQVGDMYDIPASVDDLSKIATNTIKSVLRQKINEAEKAVLYATFKDKIGEMITGVVEKSDDWSTSVNIGRTSVSLSRREKIGNETFRPGDTIKLYVKSVDEDVKGTKILVSRADPNFLKRLMEEEMHEIYEGTVVIKAIAREAGDRSKVAVTTSDPNIDPTGACIGPNGSRIQRVVSQLGNGSSKEKIDVILWNENVGVMLSEALKPSTVIGLK